MCLRCVRCVHINNHTAERLHRICLKTHSQNRSHRHRIVLKRNSNHLFCIHLFLFSFAPTHGNASDQLCPYVRYVWVENPKTNATNATPRTPVFSNFPLVSAAGAAPFYITNTGPFAPIKCAQTHLCSIGNPPIWTVRATTFPPLGGPIRAVHTANTHRTPVGVESERILIKLFRFRAMCEYKRAARLSRVVYFHRER